MDTAKVYAVKFTDERDHTTIACHCELRDGAGFKGLCFVTPPDRPHMIPGAVTKETSSGFKYNSTGYAPGEWDFTALTINNFRERFGGLVMADPQLDTVSTTEELYEYFNRMFPV